MRILLVEDDEDVARFIRKGLVENAYAVDVADDGEQALELAGTTSYDAIVLDLMIPEPDGVAVCRSVRADGSSVPILMLTARGSVDDKIAVPTVARRPRSGDETHVDARLRAHDLLRVLGILVSERYARTARPLSACADPCALRDRSSTPNVRRISPAAWRHAS